MRNYISKRIKEDNFFLHADMWNTNRFNIKGKVINTGLGESNLLNIAGGIASNGKTVYVYGVCGFIIHRLEQLKFSCKEFGAKKGKIIILNAGKYGYEDLGIGHLMDDDIGIMKILNIPSYIPENIQQLETIWDSIDEQENGIFYIQLGKDE